MNILLNVFVDTILPIILIVVILALAFLIYFLTKKNFNKPVISIRTNTTPLVTLKERYCSEQEMQFLEAVHKALPREFIAFPNVGVSSLIKPKNNMGDYKSVMDKYLDVCIFLRKEMTPVLVIDLYDQSPAKQQLKKFDDNVTNVLKVIKVPVIHKQIQTKYDSNDLRLELLNAMNSTTVAYLKDKILDQVSKK